MSILQKVIRCLALNRSIRVASGNVFRCATPKTFKHLKVNIKGKGNIVEIDDVYSHDSRLTIKIIGNGNIVKIGNTSLLKAVMQIGLPKTPVENCTLSIGNGSGCCDARFMMCEDNYQIIIGQKVMISDNVQIWCTDTHSVVDMEGNLLNEGKEVKIGDHVWIGRDVHISKNTYIADNSIVGWGSIVTGKHTEPNVILAGVPARVVKRNVTWDGRNPKTYLAENRNRSADKIKTC